jgi:hypothetical protein
VSKSGNINLDKIHSYLLRLPGVFTSRDAEAIVNRVQIEKTSLLGFTFHEFERLFLAFTPAQSMGSPAKSNG